MRLIERLAAANKFLLFLFISAFFPLMVREKVVGCVTYNLSAYTEKKHDL